MPAPVIPPRVRTTTMGYVTGLASGGYAISIVWLLVGHRNDVVSTATLQWFVWWWGIVCLAYLSTQVIPMMTALSADEAEFRINKITSWFPVVATIAALLFGTRPGTIPGVWEIHLENIITSVLDLTLLLATVLLRRKFRTVTDQVARLAPLEADHDWLDARVSQLEGAWPAGGARVPAPPAPRPVI